MSLASADFDLIRELVHAHSGVLLEENRAYLAESRLVPVMREAHLASLGDLTARLRAEAPADLHRKVVEAMITTETSFFRDVHPFETLRRVVLPALLTERAAERSLALWDAACSSGQETYSIAMVLADQVPLAAGWKVRLLASDLLEPMVARAREGRYGQLEINRGLPAAMLVKYFERSGANWQVAESLRRMVELRVTNLTQAWPAMPPMDVVFMRNVLIYFDIESRRAVLGKLRRVLRSDGYLFLGSAETTAGVDDGFERVQVGKATCHRLRQR